MDEPKLKTHSALIRLGDAMEVLDLRHVCLRQGLPRESARFDGDEEATTLHAVAESEGRIVGCATLLQRPWKESAAWQLRGMAIDPTLRRAGVGRMLLGLLETSARHHRFSSQLWCNARVPASGFYERLGWRMESEIFDIPTAGPHVKMTKTLEDELLG